MGPTPGAGHTLTNGRTKGQTSKKTAVAGVAGRAGGPPSGMARLCEFPRGQGLPGKVVMLEETPWCDFSQKRTGLQGRIAPGIPAVRGHGMHVQGHELRQ